MAWRRLLSRWIDLHRIRPFHITFSRPTTHTHTTTLLPPAGLPSSARATQTCRPTLTHLNWPRSHTERGKRLSNRLSTFTRRDWVRLLPHEIILRRNGRHIPKGQPTTVPHIPVLRQSNHYTSWPAFFPNSEAPSASRQTRPCWGLFSEMEEQDRRALPIHQ